MARKKEIKVESRDEWRDKQIKELTTERFNIITHDIGYTLEVLGRLQGAVNTLRALMGEDYKNRLRRKYNTDDIDGINKFDLKRCRERIETYLTCLEPALNSVKQIERLPSVAEIVNMIENQKEIKL